MINLPEIKLLNFFKLAISEIRGDLKDSTSLETSWLGQLFESTRLERYSFLEQSSKVFNTKVEDPRHIDIDVSYNKKKEKLVNLFLSLGTENFSQNVLNQGQENGDELLIEGGEFKKVYSRRFDRIINLYIYTDNSNETILLYEVFKSLLIAFSDHLEIIGFRNITISGQDISEYPDFIPKTFFYRVLTIKFNYQTKVPLLKRKKLISCFTLNSTLLDG